MRAPRAEDAPAVAELIIASDVDDLGEADYSLEDLREEWAASDFELAGDARVTDDIAGYAAVRGRDEALVVVDPRRRGEGIGTALRTWAEARARERGATVLHQAAAGNAARAHLIAAGYVRERSYARLEIELTGDEPDDDEGLRALDLPADAAALYSISDAAFAQNADYHGESEQRFREEHLGTHNLRPLISVVAPGEGFALVRDFGAGIAYVDLLAVHPDAGGRGLGTRILRAVFARAARAGHRSVQLGVASDNPRARRLYERAGMSERWRVDSFAKPL